MLLRSLAYDARHGDLLGNGIVALMQRLQDWQPQQPDYLQAVRLELQQPKNDFPQYGDGDDCDLKLKVRLVYLVYLPTNFLSGE